MWLGCLLVQVQAGDPFQHWGVFAPGHDYDDAQLFCTCYLSNMSQESLDFWSQRSLTDVVGHGTNQDVSPCPVSQLPDIAHVSAAGNQAPCDVVKRGAPRRSVAEMQLEMYSKNAFFFLFAEPTHDPTGKAIAKTPAYQKGVKDFRTMEDKGFLVTKDGCIFPHDQYGQHQKGAILKGYQRSTFFFTGMMPEKATQTGGGKMTKVARDRDGWPADAQISHLCHRRPCIRGDHLQIEPRTVNLRRNYCGILGSSSCDCGMIPPCVHKYHPSDWDDPTIEYCKSRNEVAVALTGLKDKFPFKMLDRESVRVDALKSENSRKRKAAGAKTTAQTNKKLRASAQRLL